MHLFLENIWDTVRGQTTAAALSEVVLIINHTLMKLDDWGIIMYDNIQKLYIFMWYILKKLANNLEIKKALSAIALQITFL